MKNQSIDFFVFSGTGNTLRVVNHMRAVFEKHGCDVEVKLIDHSPPPPLRPNAVLGIAFPVAAQSTYPFVWYFVKALPPGQGRSAFMVDTLAGFSGGVVGPLRHCLRQKGYRTIGAFEIIMPSNYMLNKIDADANKAKIERGLAKAGQYAQCLLDETARWRSVPVFPWIMYAMSRSRWLWRMLKRMMPYTVIEDKCTKCGRCEELCPVMNINCDPLPVFGNRCVLCQRCLSFCPENALKVVGRDYVFYKAADENEMLGHVRCDAANAD